MYGVIANRCYLNSFQVFFLLGNKGFKKKSDAVTKLINIYDEIGFFLKNCHLILLNCHAKMNYNMLKVGEKSGISSHNCDILTTFAQQNEKFVSFNFQVSMVLKEATLNKLRAK